MQTTCKGTSLRRFLSLPLLRIPQYKLLLREVLKYTHYQETAHPLLLQALEQIDEVAHFVDDAVARASMHKRMLELQVSGGYNAAPHPFHLNFRPSCLPATSSHLTTSTTSSPNQVEWHADIVHTKRALIREGDLIKKLEHSSSHSVVTEEELHVVLFNDCIMYGNGEPHTKPHEATRSHA